jgi:hypothetical protein
VPKPFCPPAPEPKTVGLIIRCNWCAAILEHPGALLFTPPDRVGQCVKIHLCSGCFSVVLRDSQAAAVKIARLESEFKDLQAERGAWSTAWEILTGAREGQAHLPDAIVRAARQTTAEINRLIVDRSQLAVKLETVKRTVREALSDARRNVSTMAEMQGHGVQTRADGVRRAVAWIEGLVGDVTREGADGPESVRGETLALAAPIALTALTAPAAPVTSERDEPVSSSDAARRTP